MNKSGFKILIVVLSLILYASLNARSDFGFSVKEWGS